MSPLASRRVRRIAHQAAKPRRDLGRRPRSVGRNHSIVEAEGRKDAGHLGLVPDHEGRCPAEEREERGMQAGRQDDVVARVRVDRFVDGSRRSEDRHAPIELGRQLTFQSGDRDPVVVDVLHVDLRDEFQAKRSVRPQQVDHCRQLARFEPVPGRPGVLVGAIASRSPRHDARWLGRRATTCRPEHQVRGVCRSQPELPRAGDRLVVSREDRHTAQEIAQQEPDDARRWIDRHRCRDRRTAPDAAIGDVVAPDQVDARLSAAQIRAAGGDDHRGTRIRAHRVIRKRRRDARCERPCDAAEDMDEEQQPLRPRPSWGVMNAQERRHDGIRPKGEPLVSVCRHPRGATAM